MTYRAIGFDWGGVINGKPAKYFRHDISTILGITEDEYKTAYFHHNRLFNDGTIPFDELWRRVLEELGKKEKLDEVLAYVQKTGETHLNSDVLDLVDQLRIAGYRVGLLSNNSKEKGDEMRDLGVDQHFDVFHVSAETGLVKPEPAAFRYFSDELAVDMTELIFIDDTEKSLSTAEECGFTPMLYEDLSHCINRLKELGINL